MADPAISLVMPCYNRAHDLARVLRAYDRQDVQEPFELIAVDDASSDSTYSVLASFQPAHYTLQAVRMETNRGPAAARNRGLELARAALVLFVGDDILPAGNLVRGHLTAHRHHKEVTTAVLGRVVWPPDLPVNTLMTHIDGIGAQQFSYGYLRDGEEYDYRHFYTANLSLKREMLLALDRWFDTGFRHAAYEDAELAYRLSKRGLRIRYVAHIVGHHYHYHTIWSFSERQRRSGLMAGFLLRRHPGLSYDFRGHYLRILNLLRQARDFVRPLPEAEIARLEVYARQLASYSEWTPNLSLDRLYLGVLDYFYYDGVILSAFSGPRLRRRMHSAHANRYLLPALTGYLRQAGEQGVHLPPYPLPRPLRSRLLTTSRSWG